MMAATMPSAAMPGDGQGAWRRYRLGLRSNAPQNFAFFARRPPNGYRHGSGGRMQRYGC